MIETYISNIFDGNSKAYIYIWLSFKAKVVYVGMTNSSRGTLGRAAAHVQNNGTFRKRFIEEVGKSPENYDDFKLFSFELPKQTYFISVERSYREAVEYLVQKELQIVRGSFNFPYTVISWVRNSPRTGNSTVIKSANEIAQKFVYVYSQIDVNS
jgi:hypothetical protein